MSCDFKVGDKVVKVSMGGADVDITSPMQAPIGAVGTVTWVGVSPSGVATMHLEEWPHGSKCGHAAHNWRKVFRNKTDLSVEAFLTIKPGQFEEPRRPKAPARKRERV